jgi:hypothetical protein
VDSIISKQDQAEERISEMEYKIKNLVNIQKEKNEQP